MYTKCMQNVYKMYTTFRQTFVYKIKRTMAAKVCRNVGYIFYINILYTFCIHQF